MYWYIRREHRKTRDATAEYALKLDERDLNHRISRMQKEEETLNALALLHAARQNKKKEALFGGGDPPKQDKWFGGAPQKLEKWFGARDRDRAPPPYSSEDGMVVKKVLRPEKAHGGSDYWEDYDDGFTAVPLSPGAVKGGSISKGRHGHGWM